MLDKLVEKLAARSNRRVQVYVRAKELYEQYCYAHQVDFLNLSTEQTANARQDEGLNEAENAYRSAIALCDVESELADAATARYQLAQLRLLQGEFEEAEALIRDALKVMESLPGDQARGISGCHFHLGILALKLGRTKEASFHLHRSRGIDEAMGDLHGAAQCERAIEACEEASPGSVPRFEPPAEVQDVRDWMRSEDLEDDASYPDLADLGELPRRVPYSRREVIYVISHSEAANDEFIPRLEELGPKFGRPISFSRVAFGSTNLDKATPAKAERDQHVCAAVVILERRGLDDPCLQQFIFACIDRMVHEPDFRLFLHLHGMTVDELRRLSNAVPIIDDLFEMTHINKTPSFDRLGRDLVLFVRSVERLAPIAQWSVARLHLERAAGIAANFTLAAAGAIGLLGYPVRLFDWNLEWMGPTAPTIASFVLGLLAFPLQAPLAYAMVRGFHAMNRISLEKGPLFRWVITGVIAMTGANALVYELKGPQSWLILGVAAGLVLDAMRRSGQRATCKLFDLGEMKKQADEPARNDDLESALTTGEVNPFYCPVLPPAATRVFISYTPSSETGSAVAGQLYSKLKKVGVRPFLDRASIPIGSNWRKSLNDHLADCDVFVCILDEKSIQREWVAAEVQATLRMRKLVGSPQMILLVDPAIRKRPPEMLPIFRSIVSGNNVEKERFQITELNSQSIDTLVWGLSSGRFKPDSILNSLLAIPIRLAMLPLILVAGMGFMPSLILGFLAVLERSGKFPLTAWIVNHGLIAPFTLLAAFLLGVSTRCIIAAWCGVGRDQDPGITEPTTPPTLAAASLVTALALFVPLAPALVIGWAVVFLCAGWMIVDYGSTDRASHFC